MYLLSTPERTVELLPFRMTAINIGSLRGVWTNDRKRMETTEARRLSEK